MIFVQMAFLIFSCKSQDTGFFNTKWLKQGEFCYDSLFFVSDKEYRQYYFDTQLDVMGKYLVDGDTLILTAYQKVEGIVYELPADIASIPSKVIPTYQTKYLVNGSKELQSSYFEDFITGYKQVLAEGSWNYTRLE